MAPKQRTPKVSRNPNLVRGVGKYSRSKMYYKRGLWAIKAKNGGIFPCHDAQPKAPAPAAKAPKFYPADDVKKPLVNKRKPKPTKLRWEGFAQSSDGTVVTDVEVVRRLYEQVGLGWVYAITKYEPDEVCNDRNSCKK